MTLGLLELHSLGHSDRWCGPHGESPQVRGRAGTVPLQLPSSLDSCSLALGADSEDPVRRKERPGAQSQGTAGMWVWEHCLPQRPLQRCE